jgi:hypothetical protein
LTGKQVREKSREELRQLPLVQQQLKAAHAQLATYQQAMQQAYGENMKLHTRAVVALGLERLIWEGRFPNRPKVA